MTKTYDLPEQHKYQCRYCNRTFSKVGSLSGHIGGFHGRARPGTEGYVKGFSRGVNKKRSPVAVAKIKKVDVEPELPEEKPYTPDVQYVAAPPYVPESDISTKMVELSERLTKLAEDIDTVLKVSRELTRSTQK